MITNDFLLYGAYGYTGQLIAKRAAAYGLKPLLAGRDATRLSALSAETGFDYLAFSLDDSNALDKALQRTPLVVHAAGPFIHTARPMIEACIRNGVHYTDINGDISCFELIQGYDQKARAANIMLLPGVGFDVLPTDCLALFLKKKLPDANSLSIAFANSGSAVSHGTAITVAGKLGEGSARRKNGVIVKTALGEKGMTVNFGSKEMFVMSIPWGDLFTAYHTTGIPDIDTFTAIPKNVYRLLKFQGLFNWLLRTEGVRNIIRRKINKAPAGPDERMLENGKSLVWAQVKNAGGKTEEVRLEGPESYLLTAIGTLIVASKILKGKFKTGYQTPAGCFGEDLVLEIPGIKRF
jgi:short subunit dehydrogenase-like uncharacterized protein